MNLAFHLIACFAIMAIVWLWTKDKKILNFQKNLLSIAHSHGCLPIFVLERPSMVIEQLSQALDLEVVGEPAPASDSPARIHLAPLANVIFHSSAKLLKWNHAADLQTSRLILSAANPEIISETAREQLRLSLGNKIQVSIVAHEDIKGMK